MMDWVWGSRSANTNCFVSWGMLSFFTNCFESLSSSTLNGHRFCRFHNHAIAILREKKKRSKNEEETECCVVVARDCYRLRDYVKIEYSID